MHLARICDRRARRRGPRRGALGLCRPGRLTDRRGRTPACRPAPRTRSGDPVIASSSLVWLTTAQTCSLLSAAEATTILGSALKESPGGISDPGDHALCIYEDATGILEGTYIKVEINRIGFAGEADLVNLHRGAHTLKVGGFEAIGADAETDPVNEEAVLSVKLAKNVADPALWIEAPTSLVAQKAAALILPRLAAVP